MFIKRELNILLMIYLTSTTCVKYKQFVHNNQNGQCDYQQTTTKTTVVTINISKTIILVTNTKVMVQMVRTVAELSR